MIRRLIIEGLGPHESADLAFNSGGVSIVRGASEVGKSTLIDAVCFALWGQDRTGRALDWAEVRGDAAACRVELVLANGATCERVLHRRKDGRRGKTSRAWQGQPYTTERAFLTALGPLGRNAEALRQVLVPFAWIPLVQGEGGGRRFRNVLASVLPPDDIAGVVAGLMREAGHELHKADPVHEGDAKELRTRTNRERDKAAGDVERMERLVEAARQSHTEAPPDVQISQGIVDAAEQWRAFDLFAESEEQAAKVAELAIEWDARLADLGTRPEGNADAVNSARQAAHEAEQRAQRTRHRLGSAEAFLRELETKRDALQEYRHPAQRFADATNAARTELNAAITALANADSTCTHCKQPWEGAQADAQARVDSARAKVADAEVDRAEEAERLEAERVKDIERNAADLTRAATAVEDARNALEAAEDALTTARASMTTAKASSAPGVEWDRARQALGPRPVPPKPRTRPEAPTVDRPDAADLAQARQTLQEAQRRQGAAQQRAADLQTLEATLEASQHTLQDREAECARLDALVDAVRRAPSIATRQQLGALGDLGPVDLDLRADGGVDVLIDGRPWYLASTGRRVVADTWLRAGLRRAVGLPWLVMFVDCVQDVAGQNIPRVAPVVLLETRVGALEVSHE